MDRRFMVANVILIFVLLAAFCTALGFSRNLGTIGVPFSFGLSSFIFPFIATFLASYFATVWESFYLFVSLTEPVVGLAKPDGATLSTTLLYPDRSPSRWH